MGRIILLRRFIVNSEEVNRRVCLTSVHPSLECQKFTRYKGLNMIKNFGSLYAGHVDLGDLGLSATAVNDRRFDNDHLITIFERIEKLSLIHI